jgi:hypothetical protein
VHSFRKTALSPGTPAQPTWRHWTSKPTEHDPRRPAGFRRATVTISPRRRRCSRRPHDSTLTRTNPRPGLADAGSAVPASGAEAARTAGPAPDTCSAVFRQAVRSHRRRPLEVPPMRGSAVPVRERGWGLAPLEARPARRRNGL